VSTIAQQFTQGNISSTNNPLDIAINGSGFFRVSTNGSVTYTVMVSSSWIKRFYRQCTRRAADGLSGECKRCVVNRFSGCAEYYHSGYCAEQTTKLTQL
jgi:hypothetical protein